MSDQSRQGNPRHGEAPRRRFVSGVGGRMSSADAQAPASIPRTDEIVTGAQRAPHRNGVRAVSTRAVASAAFHECLVADAQDDGQFLLAPISCRSRKKWHLIRLVDSSRVELRVAELAGGTRALQLSLKISRTPQWIRLGASDRISLRCRAPSGALPNGWSSRSTETVRDPGHIDHSAASSPG